MPGSLTKMKSFFNRKRPATPIVLSLLPAVSDMQVLPIVPPLPVITPQQRMLEKLQRQTQPAPVQRITAQQIRELRELIRYRYSLDIEIWRQRGVKQFKRDKLTENMRRSDAALEVIRRTLLEWDRRELFESDAEHQKFIEIKNRLLRGVKASWVQNPPWEFVHHGGDPYEGPWEKHGTPISRVQQMNAVQQLMNVPRGPASGSRQPTVESTNRRARTNGESQRPINGTPRHVSGPERLMWHGQTPAESSRHSNYSVPPPKEGVRTPYIRAQTPFDGNGTPVSGSPILGTRSRRSTWEVQRRVTGPQWQDQPVEHG